MTDPPPAAKPDRHIAHPGERHLAPYAIRSSDAGGRRHPEPHDPLRTPFALDRHRVIECTAFRRLEHKTQVFVAGHHDHFRTRLTHTLEVAQIARCLAVALRANEELAEVISLAHDLGHPPFGHAGEVALNEAMAEAGGFNHNTHSVRVVDHLEHPFPPFRGLNLTAATRAGLTAHSTRYDKPGTAHDPNGSSVEAQIASLADRIAYNCHDLEDAIGAELITLDDLAAVGLWQSAYEPAAAAYPGKSIHAVRRVVLDTLLNDLLTSAIATSTALLTPIQSLHSVRTATTPLVCVSPAAQSRLSELEQFLVDHVYQHAQIVAVDARGRQMILKLFSAYRNDPSALPQRFAGRIDDQGPNRVICDYIAGMTDRFCTREYERLVSAPQRPPQARTLGQQEGSSEGSRL